MPIVTIKQLVEALSKLPPDTRLSYDGAPLIDIGIRMSKGYCDFTGFGTHCLSIDWRFTGSHQESLLNGPSAKINAVEEHAGTGSQQNSWSDMVQLLSDHPEAGKHLAFPCASKEGAFGAQDNWLAEVTLNPEWRGKPLIIMLAPEGFTHPTN